ncbi:MAG: UDP-N-acetylglucosamine 2-epimerase (non-hydrolyzing) [Cytophagia bacterium]|nr:UDP-N-acetylglucosamine 2-epimerase (non-hydrolyzing) [Cytophagia bacterium]
MKITLIAGARPNFMKIAPIIHEIERVAKKDKYIEYRLVHTGQHYDHTMSQKFFDELNIPEPNRNLGAGGGTPAEQTGAIMIGFEKELSEFTPDLVIVVGDVTSTLACSIVAKKAGIKVAHVEAGIRSGDLSMPEEINRMVTDSISDYFFTTSHSANENLKLLGVPEEKIHFVGNTMIDTLLKNIDRLRKPDCFDLLKLEKGKYLVLTMHRPSNVDEETHFFNTLDAISENSGGYPVVFPVHPRTEKVLNDRKESYDSSIIRFIEPLGYLEFNYLIKNSIGVITDSGGITEEATFLNIPCMTLRDNTERPETVLEGTNELVGTNPTKIPEYLNRLVNGGWKTGKVPELWDGNTAFRIIDTLLTIER